MLVTNKDYSSPHRDKLNKDDQREFDYALRSVKYHQKEIESHKDQQRKEIKIIRKLIRKACKK